ncbi:FecR domain-containing protein [Rapidithrix thailandica]|uniref:FecR domain-containing protein n=1 Tax=Rapidithrix thailandica TaxID=413964 RepID=A0AAW9SAE2_9BACT
MKIEDYTTNESFQRWVKGDQKSAIYWEQYLATHPHEKEAVEKARQLLMALSQEDLIQVPDQEKVVNQLWQKINTTLEKEPSTQADYTTQPTYKHFRISPWQRWISYAAMLLLGLFSVWYFRSEPSIVHPQKSFSYITKKAKKGTKLTIPLSDGSLVKLNADTEIRYPEDFATHRQVYLKGEAYFEVQKDSLHPFEVITRDLNVKVLGTSFNVKAYPEETSQQVALVEGKVKVGSNPESNLKKTFTEYLIPTEMLTFQQEESEVAKEIFDPMEVLSWQDNIIYFKDASFKEVIKVLERWYGVDFIIQNPQRKFYNKFNGTYQNKSLAQVLEGVSFALKFDYQVKHKKVIIQ